MAAHLKGKVSVLDFTGYCAKKFRDLLRLYQASGRSPMRSIRLRY